MPVSFEISRSQRGKKNDHQAYPNKNPKQIRPVLPRRTASNRAVFFNYAAVPISIIVISLKKLSCWKSSLRDCIVVHVIYERTSWKNVLAALSRNLRGVLLCACENLQSWLVLRGCWAACRHCRHRCRVGELSQMMTIPWQGVPTFLKIVFVFMRPFCFWKSLFIKFIRVEICIFWIGLTNCGNGSDFSMLFGFMLV